MVVVVNSRDKYTKRNVSIRNLSKVKVIKKITQAAGLRLQLLTAVLSDIVHSTMVTDEADILIPPP
jgi:hypothetical protein